jgi:hypothetical protein
VSLDDKVFEELKKKLGRAAESFVRVGVLAGEGGDAVVEGGDITLVELAAIHEFGSPAAGIPERSFIRSTFRGRDNREKLSRLLASNARGLIHDKITVDVALDRVGAWGASAVKNTIKRRQTTGPEPQENKPATIARKGSSTPLVDSAVLLNSITHEKVIA